MKLIFEVIGFPLINTHSLYLILNLLGEVLIRGQLFRGCLKEGAFFVHLKSYFCSQDIQISVLIFGHVAKQLDQKDKVNLKFDDFSVCLINNCNIHIAQYLDNQTMKLGQLIECEMRSIFLEKSSTKQGRETSPVFFCGKLKLSTYLDQQPKVLYSWFLLNRKLKAIEIYRN